MQWKIPSTLSAWVQRAGRAARDRKRTGLAVLLVEPSKYQVNPEMPTAGATGGGRGGRARGRGRGRGSGQRCSGRQGGTPTGPTPLGKEYADAHGLRRGSADGKHDEACKGTEPKLTEDSLAEGLYVFVQTTTCRRRVLTAVYGNAEPREYPVPQVTVLHLPTDMQMFQRHRAVIYAIQGSLTLSDLEGHRQQHVSHPSENASPILTYAPLCTLGGAR